jgi:hypothetical protein
MGIESRLIHVYDFNIDKKFIQEREDRVIRDKIKFIKSKKVKLNESSLQGLIIVVRI